MKDNFSTQASLYAQFRPNYPAELYDFILSHVPARTTAWDCATGNGQAAVVLAQYFEQVEATDLSQKQLDNAPNLPNIHYQASPAESTPFAENTFDLVTVAQALHWFNFEQFYAEVRRVSKSNGMLAVWGYGLNSISPEVDAIVGHYYENVIGSYWDAERRHIEVEYASIPFPFEEIICPKFQGIKYWNLAHVEGYLNTWSATQHFIKKNGYNPVGQVIEALKSVWADDEIKSVTFPIFLKIGKI